MKIRAHVFVSGRVQGVNFRSALRFQAERLGVAGWVRNLNDGRVEAVFEGEAQAVRELVDYCRHGPRLAQVANVDVRYERYVGAENGFNMVR